MRLAYTSQSIVHPGGKPHGNSRRELKKKPPRNVSYWIATLAGSDCSLIPPRTILPKDGTSHKGLGLPTLIRKMPSTEA